MAKSTSMTCPIVGRLMKVFETEKDALTCIKFSAEDNGLLRAYYCTACGGWHVAHHTPDAESVQQMYDMIDKQRENTAFLRKERKERNRTQAGYIQTMQELVRQMQTPEACLCEQYLHTCHENYPKMLQAGGTKRSARRVFSLYGIDIERDLLTLNIEDVNFKEQIMNLADKMKRAIHKSAPKTEETTGSRQTLEQEIADLEKQYDEDDLYKKAQERKQKQLRKEFLECRMQIREKYDNLELSNNDRQRELHFNGLRPSAMDIVKIALPPEKGGRDNWEYALALVRDENHYLMALDLYPHPEQEDNITTCMDENPDGTFEGIWPKNCVLQEVSQFEQRMMRMLVDKYADDIEKAKVFVENAQQRDLDEIASLATDIHDLTQAIDAYGKIDEVLQQKRAELAEASVAEIQTVEQKTATPTEKQESLAVDTTDYEQRYQHLAYVRGKRDLIDMSYPLIDTKYKTWLRFRLMSNVVRLFEKVASWKPLTYVLSEEYMEELKSRTKSSYRGMLPQDVVPDETVAQGVLVFKNQGHEDTIIYEINNVMQLSIIVAYIREGRLMFYESYSEQQVIGRPRIDNYMCDSMRDSGTDVNRMFSWIRNLIISFLAMERDMERTMKSMVEDGKGTAEVREIKMDENLRTDLNEDVVIRDANWYTDISIDHLIPVRGYVSHRWCGKGKDKVLKQVWVRPHERNGYHREAGVAKANKETLNTQWE